MQMWECRAGLQSLKVDNVPREIDDLGRYVVKKREKVGRSGRARSEMNIRKPQCPVFMPHLRTPQRTLINWTISMLETLSDTVFKN
jgi:hypothetical protein